MWKNIKKIKSGHTGLNDENLLHVKFNLNANN